MGSGLPEEEIFKLRCDRDIEELGKGEENGENSISSLLFSGKDAISFPLQKKPLKCMGLASSTPV